MLEGMSAWGYDGGLGLAEPANGAQRLDEAAAMRLLASVDYGRVVFSLRSLPAIRPVNHLVDEGRIIIRTRLTSAIFRECRWVAGLDLCTPWRPLGTCPALPRRWPQGRSTGGPDMRVYAFPTLPAKCRVGCH